MLAVRPEARDLGIGRRLKEHQRAHCLALGVTTIYWTYDPLVARNAHLNLVRLGARVVEYVTNMYGAETDSPLHRGIGSDRFVVAWDLAPNPELGAPAMDAARAAVLRDAPVLNPDGVMPAPLAGRAARVEIPCDLAAVQARSLERAAAWRASTREAFTSALAAGWRVAGFVRDRDTGGCHYLLERP
jgi:predicted GNAT superfamily acetyltransferase